MNQNPEQIARDNIDRQLTACGWVIQNKNQINLQAGIESFKEIMATINGK